tara:strand:+ start:30590 stop:30799 length:210 start_codon:yes stop_codon:yes gene_type:complete
MTDARDGSMTGITGPMPPLQAETFASAPAVWRAIPRVGVSEAILRALSERGAVETRWENGVRQWRRATE